MLQTDRDESAPLRREEEAVATRPMNASAADSSHGPLCPRCGRPVWRVRRRFVDLLIGIFISIRRFRCSAMSCEWEGNLRVRLPVLPSELHGYPVRRRAAPGK